MLPRAALVILTLLSGCASTSLLEALDAPNDGVPLDGPELVAFVHANVLTMEKEEVLADHTVVVKGDTIVRVAPSSWLSLGPKVKVIDARGRYLMPGLADMHGHADWSASLPLLLANGVTTVRSMWGTPAQLLWREQVKKGTRLGPTLVVGSPILDGVPATWDGARALATPDDAAREVQEARRLGYDFIKVYNRLTPEVYQAVAREAQRLGLPVAGHVPSRVGLDAALGTQRSIEHFTGYLEALQRADSPVLGKDDFISRYVEMADHVDVAKIAELAHKTAAAGVYNCVTLEVMRRFVPPAQGALLLKAPEMRYAPPELLTSWDPSNDFRLKAFTEREWAGIRKSVTVREQLVRALRDAGAPILAGTDFNNPYLVPGFSLHDELAGLHAAGLTRFEALVAATRAAGEFLHLNVGLVREGQRADLLLLENNPLDDLAATRHRLGVMARGRWYTTTQLQTLIDTIPATFAHRTHRLPPTPAPKGAVVHELEITWDGRPFAEERVVLSQTDGHRYLTGQFASDGLDGVTAHLELDAEPGVRWRLAWEVTRPEGKGHLELDWHDGVLHLTGELAVLGPVDRTLPLKSGLLFGPTGAFALAAEQAVDWSSVGADEPLDAAWLDLDVGLSFEAFAVTRHPGPALWLEGKGAAVEVELKRDGTAMTLTRQVGVMRFAPATALSH